MALVKCPECGREISDQAVSCPGCGAPGKKVEAPAYQLSVPQGTEMSYFGTLSRALIGISWVVGLIFAIKYFSETQKIGSFVLVLLISFVVSLIPLVFAQFFDDVHTIRHALQGLTLAHEAKTTAYQPKTSDKEVYCTKCNKFYAKYYDACPYCGQER